MREKLKWVLLACALMLTVPRVSADRLHLESGGVIETANWWVEEDKILYRSRAGTVGIPRSMVLRIERSPVASSIESSATARPVSRSVEQDNKRLDAVRVQIETGASALELGDYETASGHFFHAMSLEPEAYAARVQYIFCEIQLGQDASALSAALDGLVLAPEGAELHELLGDLKDRDENLHEALRSWRKAFSIKPHDRIRTKIEKGERDLQARRDYELARTSHFNLRYDGDVDEALAADVTEYLEQVFWDLTNTYSHTPRQAVTALLYPNQAFRDVTQAAESVAGLYDGKIRVPLGGLSHLHRGAKRVLKHELTHAVVHSKSRGRCPRWLHEGLAQISDGTVLDSVKQRKVSEQLAGLDDATSWDKDGLSYPLAQSLVLWLEDQRGFPHLVWVLELLGNGQSVDEALERAYGDDYAALCRRWSAEVSRRRQ